MRHWFNKNTWNNSTFEKFRNQVRDSYTLGKYENSCIETSRKTDCTYLVLLSPVWLGGNSQLLVFPWEGKERNGTHHLMVRLCVGLPQQLVSALPIFNCWQEKTPKWGAAENKSNSLNHCTHLPLPLLSIQHKESRRKLTTLASLWERKELENTFIVMVSWGRGGISTTLGFCLN